MKNKTFFSIPTIYGESMSYYEEVNKLKEAVNALIEEYNEIPEYIENEVISEVNEKPVKVEGYVTPQMYGALGDGVADDTDAIQRAIDDAYQTKQELYIPKGVYIIDPVKALHVKSGIKITGCGYNSVLKVKPETNVLNNIVKCESVNNVVIRDIRLDGNRNTLSKSDTESCNYGLYFGVCEDCTVQRVISSNFTGVGIHVYGSKNIKVDSCVSANNAYHGYEIEQCQMCVVSKCMAESNDRSGFVLNPGEVNFKGSTGNIITSSVSYANGDYGVLVSAGNNHEAIGTSTSENTITGNVLYKNMGYGVCLYDNSKILVSNNIIMKNGVDKYVAGVYLKNSSYNTIINNRIINNAISSNGQVFASQILIEKDSGYNSVFNNTISCDAGSSEFTYAGWALHESTGQVKPNFIIDNFAYPEKSDPIKIVHAKSVLRTISADPVKNTDTLRMFTNGLAIAPNATLPGQTMGLDAPFGSAVMRVYNELGNTQIVNPNGTVDIYNKGKNTFTAAETFLSARSLPVKEVGDPVDEGDAVNKKTLDDRVYVIKAHPTSNLTLQENMYNVSQMIYRSNLPLTNVTGPEIHKEDIPIGGSCSKTGVQYDRYDKQDVGGNTMMSVTFARSKPGGTIEITTDDYFEIVMLRQ